ncbi:hypothetical protein DXG03_003465 [Asterophora parasitica]|uniref:Uncharacterized protein n=1 Tax=Asterophora parasitica TaxID=117018 RepID=A0A9P7GBT5_9AGAR|nr:hypothetical protein DXG03_003465 [Asterophora parasitica]
MSINQESERTSVGFVTLGMFIVDEFSFADNDGNPTARTVDSQERPKNQLPDSDIGMIVDRGRDFPSSIEAKLLEYGSEMWIFRDQPHLPTTRALNSYRGEHRK